MSLRRRTLQHETIGILHDTIEWIKMYTVTVWKTMKQFHHAKFHHTMNRNVLEKTNKTKQKIQMELMKKPNCWNKDKIYFYTWRSNWILQHIVYFIHTDHWNKLEPWKLKPNFAIITVDIDFWKVLAMVKSHTKIFERCDDVNFMTIPHWSNFIWIRNNERDPPPSEVRERERERQCYARVLTKHKIKLNTCTWDNAKTKLKDIGYFKIRIFTSIYFKMKVHTTVKLYVVYKNVKW